MTPQPLRAVDIGIAAALALLYVLLLFALYARTPNPLAAPLLPIGQVANTIATASARTYPVTLPHGCAPPTEPGDELHLRVRVNAKGIPSTACQAKRIAQGPR